jgi:hypothetical protein
MADLQRLRVQWSGAGVVGAGLSTFYDQGGASPGLADDIETFLNAIKTIVTNQVVWTIPSNGDFISDATGELSGSWSDPGTGGSVAGTGSGNFANGVGARIVWNTGGIFNGRRVRGSTFIVPLGIDTFENSSNLTTTAVSTLQSAADALVAARDTLAIWSRPTNLAGDNGESNVITSATVFDKVSWLRSRRT